MELCWIHPFSAIVAGPSGCGKSEFVCKFINNISEMCNTKFDRILFYFAEMQNGYSRMKFNIEFIEGLPNNNDYTHDNSKKKLIIIDDLMREGAGSDIILDLFTKKSHHCNISVILLTQNLFHKGKIQRDISLNTKYMVIFKNPRDNSQIMHLARQINPQNPKFVQQAFLDSTIRPHGYLLIDLCQDTPEEYRYRSCIFPEDNPKYVYVPRR